MGTIDIISKWDLEKNIWNTTPLYNDLGRSFAFGEYKRIINNPNYKFDYIIIANGSRVEDHSKDSINIKEKEVSINKIINYFKNFNRNTIIKLFLMDADAPIKEDAILFANYIDNLSILPNTNSINIIGISKCGAMLFNTPKHFKNPSSFTKTNLYTIATPFEGTKLASPKFFYPEIERLIISHLGYTNLSNLVSKSLIAFYESISSNSHMDYDIAHLGGIPENKLQFYDESLIKYMFSNDNLDSITKLNSYKNLVTGIDQKTLKEAFKNMDFIGIGLCILNDLFFNKKSDGMVTISSQRIIESKINLPDFKSHILTSAHHNVTGNNRILNDILYLVNDTIEEQIEKTNYKTKSLKK